MVGKKLKPLPHEQNLIDTFDLSYTVILCWMRSPICIYKEMKNKIEASQFPVYWDGKSVCLQNGYSKVLNTIASSPNPLPILSLRGRLGLACCLQKLSLQLQLTFKWKASEQVALKTLNYDRFTVQYIRPHWLLKLKFFTTAFLYTLVEMHN